MKTMNYEMTNFGSLPEFDRKFRQAADIFHFRIHGFSFQDFTFFISAARAWMAGAASKEGHLVTVK